MKKLYFVLICSIVALSLVSCTKSERSEETPYGRKSYIEICGLKWATQNVGATKDNPYGSLYTYEQALKACPEDWRLPTGDELKQLSLFHSVPVSFDGMNGMWFSGSIPYKEGVDAVFLTMAGGSFNGSKQNSGESAYYWSSTEYHHVTEYYHVCVLCFDGSSVDLKSSNRSDVCSVRCVKD